jgi:hypothetical protein
MKTPQSQASQSSWSLELVQQRRSSELKINKLKYEAWMAPSWVTLFVEFFIAFISLSITEAYGVDGILD